jgi:hypothetical protein
MTGWKCHSTDAALRSALARTGVQPKELTPSGGSHRLGVVVAEELRRLFTWEERHRRLLARLIIAFSLTVIVDLLGALLVWNWESGIKGSDIHGFPDALFFTTVQVLTVSSSLKNPLTGIGKIVDIALELWAIGVVTAVAGSFSTFFASGDA